MDKASCQDEGSDSSGQSRKSFSQPLAPATYLSSKGILTQTALETQKGRNLNIIYMANIKVHDETFKANTFTHLQVLEQPAEKVSKWIWQESLLSCMRPNCYKLKVALLVTAP